MTAYGIRFKSAVVRVANDARVEGLGIDTQDTNNQGLEQQPQRRDVPRDPFGPRVQRREGKRRIHEVARKRASGKSCSCAALPQAPNRSTGLPTAPSGPVGVGSRHLTSRALDRDHRDSTPRLRPCSPGFVIGPTSVEARSTAVLPYRDVASNCRSEIA